MNKPAPDPLYSGELRARADLTLAAILRALLVVLPLIIVAGSLGTTGPAQMLVLGVTLLFVAALYFLQRRGHFELCVHATVFGLIALSALLAAIYGSVRSAGTLGQVAAITIGGLFLGRRALAAAAALSIASLGALVYAENAGWLPKPNYAVALSHWVIYSVIVAAVALVLFYMRGMMIDLVRRQKSESAQRERAEAAQQQSEARFRRMFESSPVAMTVTRLSDARYIDTNRANERTLGYTREEMIGRSMLEMGIWLSAEDRAAFIAELRAGKGVEGYDTRVRNKAGEIVHCRIWAELVELDGEECVLSSTVNVTAQESAERLRRQSEAKYTAVFNGAPDPIVIARERDAVQIDANRAWFRMTGYSREQAIGRSALELGLWADAAEREKALALLKTGGAVDNFPARFRIANGLVIDALLSGIRVMLNDEPCVVWSWREVTQLRRAQEELRSSRHLLETVIDAMPMSIFAKDLESRYILLNKRMAELFGVPKEKLLHQHTSSLPATEAARNKALGDDAWVFAHRRRLDQPEQIVTRPDGTRIPYLSTKLPLFDEAGRLFGLLGINREIAEEKRAQEALRDSEHRYRSLFQAAMDCILVISPDGAIVDVNDFGCRSLGYTRDELIGGTFARILDETKLSRMLPRPPGVKIERRALRADQEVRAKDGSVRAVEFTAGPLPDGNILVVARDVTERRRSEKLLENIAKGVSSQTGAEFFRTLVLALCRDLPAHMVFIGEAVGNGDRVRSIACCVDGALAENFEYALAGTPCVLAMERRGTVVHPQNVAGQFPLDEGLRRRGISGYAGTSLFDVTGKAIGILVALTREPIERREFVVSMLEIFAARAAAEIERLRADAQVRELNVSLERRVRERTAELEAANRDLDSFGYSVSHDLRSPLGALNGFAHLLRTREAERLSPDGVHLLRQLETNATRMTNLVEGLLEFSRLGRRPVTRVVVQMAALVGEVVEELSAENRGRRMEIRVGALADAYGDPMLLRQVWRNLIGNAVKYSRGRDPARIEIGLDPATHEYFVRDNGAGFDMQYAERLFGVFERLHSESEFEGTGIGLAIVQRVVNRHGGMVRGEGKPDEGATFRFTLPAR